MSVELGDIFNSAINNSLFVNKGVLQVRYTPESIPHRDEQIKSIASILASSLRGERPSNLFVYGKWNVIIYEFNKKCAFPKFPHPPMEARHCRFKQGVLKLQI